MSRNAYDICLTGHNLFACFVCFFCCRLLHMFVCLMPYVCVLLVCWFVSLAEKTVGRSKILWMFQKKTNIVCLIPVWRVRVFEKETVHECLKERKGMFGCPNNWSKHFWISEGGLMPYACFLSLVPYACWPVGLQAWRASLLACAPPIPYSK